MYLLLAVLLFHAAAGIAEAVILSQSNIDAGLPHSQFNEKLTNQRRSWICLCVVTVSHFFSFAVAAYFLARKKKPYFLQGLFSNALGFGTGIGAVVIFHTSSVQSECAAGSTPFVDYVSTECKYGVTNDMWHLITFEMVFFYVYIPLTAFFACCGEDRWAPGNFRPATLSSVTTTTHSAVAPSKRLCYSCTFGYSSCFSCGGRGTTNMSGCGPRSCFACGGSGRSRCLWCQGRGVLH